MAARDVVVMGGSLGAVEAAITVLAGLPATLPAALLVVVTPARTGDVGLFDRAGPLPAVAAVDGDQVEPGRVYVAGPERHLLLGPGSRVRLSSAPHYNRLRPAVDPLLLSAARWAGPRAIGILLSGLFDDGIAGLAALGMHGGLTVVQDPADAAYPDLPGTAMRMQPHHVGRAAALAAALPDLLKTPGTAPAVPDELLVKETDVLIRDSTSATSDEQFGQPVAIGCPDCGGGLHRIDTAGVIRYRCHVGHGFSAAGMLAAQAQSTESGLLTVASTVRDQAEVYRQLAANTSDTIEADRYHEAAAAADRAAATIQRLHHQRPASAGAGA